MHFEFFNIIAYISEAVGTKEVLFIENGFCHS
jgi:hypothetical protein